MLCNSLNDDVTVDFKKERRHQTHRRSLLCQILLRNYAENQPYTISTIFMPNESVLGVDDRSGPLFLDSAWDVAMATNFGQNWQK